MEDWKILWKVGDWKSLWEWFHCQPGEEAEQHGSQDWIFPLVAVVTTDL